MQLVYNHRPFDGTVPEFPDETWPHVDHEEPDAAVAQKKIDSGFFHARTEEDAAPTEFPAGPRAPTPGSGAEPAPEPAHAPEPVAEPVTEPAPAATQPVSREENRAADEKARRR
jgi:hypothetical protein